MHILIIGCGYVGLRAARQWLERGETVSALTRSPLRADEWREMGMSPIVGDVLDPDSLRQLPAADLCLYAVGFDRSAPDAKRSVYVEGLRNVLTATASRIPRLIYVSSTSVYGQSRGEWVNEESPCEPESEGGRICLEAEQVIREFDRRAECGPDTIASRRSVILRSAGIYGPGRLIGRREQFRKQEPLPGNPDAWLNLIHVEDLVQIILLLAEWDGGATTYLACDSRPVRRREFYEALAVRMGTPPPRFSSESESSLNKRCDSTRLRRELGLELRFPTIHEGLGASV
jgi:nucleoside-diphosphate-sugar epimerase